MRYGSSTCVAPAKLRIHVSMRRVRKSSGPTIACSRPSSSAHLWPGSVLHVSTRLPGCEVGKRHTKVPAGSRASARAAPRRSMSNDATTCGSSSTHTCRMLSSSRSTFRSWSRNSSPCDAEIVVVGVQPSAGKPACDSSARTSSSDSRRNSPVPSYCSSMISRSAAAV
eukprot:342048-Chlamydomonas_euryale.AAC.2